MLNISAIRCKLCVANFSQSVYTLDLITLLYIFSKGTSRRTCATESVAKISEFDWKNVS